jgi:lipid-A-disaccharide synthase-like uncharacterized protein
MAWFLIWFISVVICACIDVPYFVKNNIEDMGIGMILIMCPILNIIYSIYIIIKHGKNRFKEFL